MSSDSTSGTGGGILFLMVVEIVIEKPFPDGDVDRSLGSEPNIASAIVARANSICASVNASSVAAI